MSFHLDVIFNFQSLASWPLRVVFAVIFKEPENKATFVACSKRCFYERAWVIVH